MRGQQLLHDGDVGQRYGVRQRCVAVLIYDIGVGAVPEEYGHDGRRNSVACSTMESRHPKAVPRIHIGATRNQCQDKPRVARGTGNVQERVAIVVDCVFYDFLAPSG